MRRKRWVLVLLALAMTSAFGQKIMLLPDTDGVYPAWGGVKAARLVKAAPMTLPDDPRLVGLKGVCSLSVVVGTDGIPKTVDVVGNTKTPFDDAAIAAVRQSQFEAGSLNGAPVATRILVWVPFGSGRPAIPLTSSGAKKLKQPFPTYAPQVELSDEARRAHLSGFTVIQILVTEEGFATRLRLALPFGHGMDEKTIETVSKYKFRPATLDGVPVPAQMSIEANFRSY